MSKKSIIFAGLLLVVAISKPPNDIATTKSNPAKIIDFFDILYSPD